MKTFLRITGSLVIASILVVVALFLLHPKIPLSVFTGPCSSLLSSITNSRVHIDGSYFLIPGSWTTISVEDGDIDYLQEDGASLKIIVDSAQVTLHLWSLFDSKIALDSISSKGLAIDISGNKSGKTSPQKNEKITGSDSVPPSFSLIRTGPISLADIKVTADLSDDKPPIQFFLAEGSGEFGPNLPGSFTMSATFNGSSMDG